MSKRSMLVIEIIVGLCIFFTLVICGIFTRYNEEDFFFVPKQTTTEIEVYYQYPEYPAGCELASTCQVLNYYGHSVEISDLLYHYLPVSDEEWIDSYYGNIRTAGWAFPHAIATSTQKYLKDKNSDLMAIDISKCFWEDYKAYVDRGIPVISWHTLDYKMPNWSYSSMGGYNVWRNLHCVTVYDIDDKYVYIADPIEGFVAQEIEQFKQIWEKCGSYGVIIY